MNLRLCAMLVAAPAVSQLAISQTGTPATVYRDEYGMPHIEAETEPAAYYALGYEQARDELLLIQMAVKRLRGQWCHYNPFFVAQQNNPTLGAGARQGVILADLLVDVLATRPSSPDEFDWTLFQSTQVGISYVDLCVAYAAGVNDYMDAVNNATSTTPQNNAYVLRQWLSGNNLSWVYLEHVDEYDFLSYGPYINAILGTFQAMAKRGPRPNTVDGVMIRSSGASGQQPLLDVTGDPARDYWTEFMARAKGYPGMGSNGFVWSHGACKDANNVWYSGCVADPHQGQVFTHTAAGSGFLADLCTLDDVINAHGWTAHVIVKDLDTGGNAGVKLDVLGHVQAGSGSFFEAHNCNLAYGGSAGGGNTCDKFLLRLEADPATGQPKTPYKYYSYYADSSPIPSGSAPAIPANNTYVALTEITYQLRVAGNTYLPIKYWRAGVFGFILPDAGELELYVRNNYNNAGAAPPPPGLPVMFGEKCEPTHSTPWRFRNKEAMQYWATPQVQGNTITTSPIVSALRLPMDSNVANDVNARLLMKHMWEAAHMTNVYDLFVRLNNQEFSYFVNLAVCDRSGSTLSVSLGNVPKRGRDDLIYAGPWYNVNGTMTRSAPANTFPDKYLVAGPNAVPARCKEDQIFDWVWAGAPPNLTYLTYLHPTTHTFPQLPASWTNPQTAAPDWFKPCVLGIPDWAFMWPLANFQGQGSTFSTENGGYGAMCNSTPWQAVTKSTFAVAIPGATSPWQNACPNNYVYNCALWGGTVYSSAAFFSATDERNRTVIDKMLGIVDTARNGGNIAPMTIAEAKQFAVGANAYAAQGHKPRQIESVDLVRQVHANPSPQNPPDPLEEAVSEAFFFKGWIITRIISWCQRILPITRLPRGR
ncbi:MAG: penicillin acylase family protein [Planctomycetota bacterium]